MSISTPTRAKPASTRGSADDKQARILVAARTVCARMGYEAATMEAVAAEARVSKGTLYNFFESKEDLFLATVLQAYDEAERRTDLYVGSPDDPEGRLHGWIRGLVESFEDVTAGMMVNLQVWAVVARGGPSQERLFADLRERYARIDAELVATLRAGQEKGVFRRGFEPEAVAQGLVALYDGYVYRSVFDAERAHAESLRQTLKHALEGLVRGSVLPAAREQGDPQ